MYFKDSLPYWKKNMSKFLFIFSAIVIGMTAIIVSALLNRSQALNELAEALKLGGNYDFIMYDVPDDTAEEIAAMECVGETGRIRKLGTAQMGQTEFPVGALEGSRAEEMFSLVPVQGRYPKKKGEIAIDRITMLSNGLLPVTGQTVRIRFGQEKSSQEREYIVVGIIEQQYMEEDGNMYCRRGYRQYYGYDPAAESAPLAYIFDEEAREISSAGNSILIINLKLDGGYEKSDFLQAYWQGYEGQEEELKFDVNGTGRNDYARAILGYNFDNYDGMNPQSYQEALEQIGGESTEKDVYSRVLIPLFSLLIAVATFFSVLEATSSVFVTREKQMGVYRCIGMSRGQAILKTLVELLIAVVPAMVVGCLLGTAVYEGILLALNSLCGTRLSQAFDIELFYEPFIKAATVPPYAFAVGFIGVMEAAVIALFLFRNSKLTPLASSNRGRYALEKDRINRILLGIHITLLITVITVAFLYFTGEAEAETSYERHMVDTMFYDSSDYAMQIDTNLSYDGGLYGFEGRHDAGVSGEAYRSLSENPNVEALHGIIQCYGTRLTYDESIQVDEEALAGYQITEGMYEGEFELVQMALGYKETDRIYLAQTVGLEEADLLELAPNVTEGEIRPEEVNAGREVVLVAEEGVDLPFTAGDVLPMGMVVLPPEIDTSEEYWLGEYEFEGEPTYPATEEHREIFVVGTRKDWEVTVGAIVYLDEAQSAFYKTESYPPLGMNFLTTTQGMAAWDIPAVNYTKLVVRLKEDADTDAFEAVWFSLLNEGKIMTTRSVSGLNAKIATVRQKNRIIFLAMAIMMILTSSIGIFNAIHMRVLFCKKRNAVLRALGQNNGRIVWQLQKSQAAMVLCGCAIAEVTVCILGRLRQIIYDVYENWTTGENAPLDDWWGFSFPFKAKAWEWQDCLIPVAVGAVIFAIAAGIVYVTYRKTAGRESIAESMREE